jgi:hydrogenase maturation protein HypF
VHVQGIGFRPTIYRIAEKLRVAGWVRDTSRGIEIEIEGNSEQIREFLQLLKEERPRGALVQTEEVPRIAPSGSKWFEILLSS